MKTLNFYLFLIPLFTITLLNVVVPHEQTISEFEKRTLMPLPVLSLEALKSGKYFRDFDNYFADHFLFRERLVQVGSSLKELRGLPEEEGASIVVQKGNNMFQNMAGANEKLVNSERVMAVVQDSETLREKGPADNMDTVESAKSNVDPEKTKLEVSANQDRNAVEVSRKAESKPAGASSKVAAISVAPPVEHPGNLEETGTDKYLVLKDRAFSLFSYVAAYANEYAHAINEFRMAIDPQINVYSLLVPSSTEFINSDKYKSLSDSQKRAIESVNQKFAKNITPIDAYSELADHADEYVYFKTDHHWTALGAYYGYQAFMKKIGETPIPLSQYETVKYQGFLGSAYGATLNNNLKKNPDTITIYKPFVPHKYTLFWFDNVPLIRNVVDLDYAKKEGGAYRIFLEGDSPWGRITMDDHHGKRLLVIKDSYGNPFVPFLLPHFEQVYFLDLRYFKTNVIDFVKEKQITDVLFVDGIAVTSSDGFAALLSSKMQ